LPGSCSLPREQEQEGEPSGKHCEKSGITFPEAMKKAFTLIELLVVVAIIGIITALLVPAVNASRAAASRAVSTHTLHQLLVGGQGYLGDHNYKFWPYQYFTSTGTQWWFGFETWESQGMPEGERTCDYSIGPLGPYTSTSGGIKTDPAFLQSAQRLKPKYKNGNYGYGYNSVLSGSSSYPGGPSVPISALQIQNYSQIIVFATSAQVNDFEPPASPDKPMIEEFYMINDDARQYPSIHFRHGGHALAAFLDGSVRSLDMSSDMVPGSQDMRMPSANIGRLPSTYFRQSDW